MYRDIQSEISARAEEICPFEPHRVLDADYQQLQNEARIRAQHELFQELLAEIERLQHGRI